MRRGILLSFHLYVHCSVMLMEMTQFLSNHLSESIHTWVLGTLEGLLSYINSGPRVYTGGEAGYQNLGHLKKCYTAFSVMLASSKDI